MDQAEQAQRTRGRPDGHALRVGLITVAIMLAGVVVLVALVAAANVFTLPIEASATGSTYAAILILFAGTGLGLLLVGALVAILLDDYYVHRTISSIYYPILTFAGILAWLVLLSSVSAMDVLVHDLRTGWHLTDDPELRLFSNLLLLALFVSLSWLIGIVLRGRDWTSRDLILLFITAGVLSALIAVVPFALT